MKTCGAGEKAFNRKDINCRILLMQSLENLFAGISSSRWSCIYCMNDTCFSANLLISIYLTSIRGRLDNVDM